MSAELYEESSSPPLAISLASLSATIFIACHGRDRYIAIAQDEVAKLG